MARDGWVHLPADRSKMLMEQHMLRVNGHSVATILCPRPLCRVLILSLRDGCVNNFTYDPDMEPLEFRKKVVEQLMRNAGWPIAQAHTS